MFLMLYRFFLIALIAAMLAACSNSEEPAEKGHIEQTTEKIAREATASITTPVSQANLAKELTEQHNEGIEENVHQVDK